MSRVIHFEIQASQPEQLIEFYRQLFDWKFNKWGEVDYWLIETGPMDQPGINGGLLPRRGDLPADQQPVNCYVCTVQVSSLDETLQRASSLGGTLAVPRMPVQGIGWLAYIKDPDGNILGMMQPDEKAA